MLDEVPFEVERALTVDGRPVVYARLLGPAGDLAAGPGATLDGRELERPYMQVPRAPGPGGRPRLDLFVFPLRHERDLSRFEPGRRVILRATRPGPTAGA